MINITNILIAIKISWAHFKLVSVGESTRRERNQQVEVTLGSNGRGRAWVLLCCFIFSRKTLLKM